MATAARIHRCHQRKASRKRNAAAGTNHREDSVLEGLAQGLEGWVGEPPPEFRTEPLRATAAELAFLIGAAHQKTGHDGAATAAYLTALRLDEGLLPARGNLALIHVAQAAAALKAGRTEDARRALAAARKVHAPVRNEPEYREVADQLR